MTGDQYDFEDARRRRLDEQWAEDIARLQSVIVGGRKGRVADARRALKRRTTDKLREELGR